jgi:hypothetical protein
VATDGELAVPAAKPAPGRPRKLPPRECQRLSEQVFMEAMVYGHPDEV